MNNLLRPLYIFDFDGTLSLPDHRRHLLESNEPDKWDKFFLACDKDLPNKPVIEIFNQLIKNNDIYIFSGRSDIARLKSWEWLRKYTILFNDDVRLLMREQGDFTPDHILKKQWLDNMVDEDRQRLVAVFDDRDSVVKMWRDNGITCLQVNYGNF